MAWTFTVDMIVMKTGVFSTICENLKMTQYSSNSHTNHLKTLQLNLAAELMTINKGHSKISRDFILPWIKKPLSCTITTWP